MKSKRLGIASNQSNQWVVPVILIALLAFPIIAGGIRLVEIQIGTLIITDHLPHVSEALPLTLHITSTIFFCLFGAFQFIPKLRKPRTNWHRISGRLTATAGIIVPMSGIWLTLFADLPLEDSYALNVIRLLVSLTMLYAIIKGLRAIWEKRFIDHRIWMIRAYAIAAGTGAQIFTSILVIAIYGELDSTTKTIAMAVGWALAIVVAEWHINRTNLSATSTISSKP